VARRCACAARTGRLFGPFTRSSHFNGWITTREPHVGTNRLPAAPGRALTLLGMAVSFACAGQPPAPARADPRVRADPPGYTAPATTGLEGTVRRGPVHPVCRTGEPCDAPLRASFHVW
jgi:hypothetical protein